MKFFLRSFVFAYIGLYVTDQVIGGFKFGNSFVPPFMLVVLALALLNMFTTPVFKMISLPSKGVFYLFLTILITFITLYVLTVFIPQFEIGEATIRRAKVFGFILPEKELTFLWSGIFSATCFSIVNNFFVWLSTGKK